MKLALFLVQRCDCAYLCLADDIDPVDVRAFHFATKAEPETLCYCCRLTMEGIVVGRRRPIRWPLGG